MCRIAPTIQMPYNDLAPRTPNNTRIPLDSLLAKSTDRLFTLNTTHTSKYYTYRNLLLS